MTKYTFLLTFLFSSALFAQQKKLYGKIENKKDMEGIHILNTSSRYNSVTNEIGEFFITVKPSDTLLVSSVTYVPEQVVVTQEVYEQGYISITLRDLVNELDEVFLGPNLSGDLERDLKNIEVEDQINFDDVGIPGFKGKAEEKIPNLVGQVITPFSVNVEGLYKYISGYYKKLKMRRKWESQNVLVSLLLYHYPQGYFNEAYQIPEERTYDFLLYCVETSNMQKYFDGGHHGQVMEIFEEKAAEYRKRLNEKKE
ncbi:hypothetical protein POV27_18560 [Aureisphaera galaxeae]|uniref:hypothetical protein n=1 Tax=Aureisphaera galaxeae TaxID=1538023 RepID=UPI00235038DC|nr:hypothetical protein [Aureisphaera galaxeae]MDC8006061.1 hypothetical protein [Aureisphaera galaxeae]